MTEYAFRSQVARLKSVFGDKAFQEAKLELVQKACRTLSDESFEKIVTHFVASFRQAPLPKDFLEAATKERASTQNYGDRAYEPEKIVCQWCNDGGIMEVGDRVTGKEYFIRCGCKAGKESYWSKLPQWRRDLGEKFQPFKMYSDRALRWKPTRFNPKEPENSLKDLVEHWKITVGFSEEFWSKFEEHAT